MLVVVVETMYWTLGWVCLLVANIVSFADVVMFQHHSWKLDSEARGQADAHQCGHVSSSWLETRW